ncbi:MAG TPA: Trm112 family protein [Burkholderiaceae bacterium]
MDAQLLDILVCPICKGPLEYTKKEQELICHADKLAYPIRDGIPIMWADDARPLNETPHPNEPPHPMPVGF